MVASYASEVNVRYLHLLPTETFSNSSQDTAALANAFNRDMSMRCNTLPLC